MMKIKIEAGHAITATELRTAEQRTGRRYTLYTRSGNEELCYKKQGKLGNVIAFDALLNTARIDKVEMLQVRHPTLSAVISEILVTQSFHNSEFNKQYDDALERNL